MLLMAGVQSEITTGALAPRGRPVLAGALRLALTRRVRFLVGFTIAYNVIEACVALAAGLVASSTALVAFGLDSVIEVSSAAAVAWQFSARDPESRERVTLRVIACSFFALAAYVCLQAVRGLVTGAEPRASTVGMVLASVSVLVMPAVSLVQRRTGQQLGSVTTVADSKQTLLCAGMSAVLLVGLALNAVLGWAWADSIAALGIGTLALREGVNAWRGDLCCAPAADIEATAGCTDGCCSPVSTEPGTRG